MIIGIAVFLYNVSKNCMDMREWHAHEKCEVTKAHLKTRNIYINYYVLYCI